MVNLLRLEPLSFGYRREFRINLLPDATLNVRAAIRFIGEEAVGTPAGGFDCWVIEGENTRLASWPIDKLWLAKMGDFVVKAVEHQDQIQVDYILEGYE